MQGRRMGVPGGRRWLVLILALSVLARLVVALYIGDYIQAPKANSDQVSYDALAQRLLAGHGYSFDTWWYPFTMPDTPTAHWSFLYPLFLAAVYAIFGPHPLAARLVQAVLGGLLLPWMLYRLTRRLQQPDGADQPPAVTPWCWTPLVAAALASIYGYFVLYAAMLMTETFYIVALLWSLERALALGTLLRRSVRVPRGLTLTFGLSLVLATLLRQSILPWVPVLFLWLLWQGRRRNFWAVLRPLVAAALLLILGIAPWTLRNYLVYGHFMLLNSNTGYAMYSAQHPMHGNRFGEYAAAPLPDDLAGTNEAEWDRDLLRRGIGFVLDDPARYLRLSLSRVRAFFEFWPTADSTPLNNAGSLLSFGLFLPFMLYGLWLAARRGSGGLPALHGRSLLYLFLLVYSVVHIMTWAMVRYRLPVDAVLLVFAALALTDLARRILDFVARRRHPAGGPVDASA